MTLRSSIKEFFRGFIGSLLIAVDALVVLVAVATGENPWMWLCLGSFGLAALAFWRFHTDRQASHLVMDQAAFAEAGNALDVAIAEGRRLDPNDETRVRSWIWITAIQLLVGILDQRHLRDELKGPAPSRDGYVKRLEHIQWRVMGTQGWHYDDPDGPKTPQPHQPDVLYPIRDADSIRGVVNEYRTRASDWVA